MKFVIIIFFITLAMLRVQNVECAIAGQECPQEVVNSLQALKGKSIFFINIQKELNEKNLVPEFYVYSTFKKTLPGALTVNFTQERPLYKLVVQEESYILGQSGVFLPQNDKDQFFPMIIWQEDVGQVIDFDGVIGKVEINQHNMFLRVAKNLEANNLQNAIITWKNEDEIFLEIKNKPRLVFDKTSLQTKLDIATTILNSRDLINFENSVKEVDLRYNLPVLRTSQ
jgi:hypothetical protein